MPSAAEDPSSLGGLATASGRTDALSVWSTDSSAPQGSTQPFASSFASRAVDDADKFVLLALDKATGEGPSPRLGAGGAAVPGELDALAFAMGALWELADASDVNQVRRSAARRTRRARAAPATYTRSCSALPRRSASRRQASRCFWRTHTPATP
jgi:hypothetical protein